MSGGVWSTPALIVVGVYGFVIFISYQLSHWQDYRQRRQLRAQRKLIERCQQKADQ
jgi:hypothetical protein